jgi:putative copper resistance protein D
VSQAFTGIHIIRWIHLASSMALVGGAVMLLLAGVSDRPTALAWQARVSRAARWLLLVALLSGLGALAQQTALLEGRAGAAVEPQALARVATQTQSGLVTIVRLGLLLFAGLFIGLRFGVADRLDWLALHGERAALALLALCLLGAGGHAAAVEPSPLRAILVDVVHVGAAAVWAGALPALVLLLRAAGREDGADARPYAVLATRRFSRWALATVLVLLASGVANAYTHVGDFPSLVGTSYGRLLVAKIALFAFALIVAALNRQRFVPKLGSAAAIGRRAMLRLANAASAEALIVLGVVGVVALLGITPPARHEQPLWPLSFRFTTTALATEPALKWQVLVGSQIAVLGIVAVLCGLVLRRRHLAAPLIAGALALMALGGAMALIPLAVDAYPTTYRRPAVPYTATSIASGSLVYIEQCAVCHGRAGGGDGPSAPRLPRPPADLRAPHTNDHTAGDLFWWVSHGIPRGQMPGFAATLSEEQRWDVINYVRFLSAMEQARWMGLKVDPNRAWLVAPDFSYSVGPAPARTLRDYRGQRHVLLVLYTLPASRARLARLAESYQVLATIGVEIIAVPTDASPDAIKRIGAEPRVLFPVVTEGAPDILAVYNRFDAATHAEFLIDKQGYIRARWATREAPVRDMNLLLAEIQELNEEKVQAPPADEHVH